MLFKMDMFVFEFLLSKKSGEENQEIFPPKVITVERGKLLAESNLELFNFFDAHYPKIQQC